MVLPWFYHGSSASYRNHHALHTMTLDLYTSLTCYSVLRITTSFTINLIILSVGGRLRPSTSLLLVEFGLYTALLEPRIAL